jgi:NAD(P)-dependent dehydrogenase (short-subunit alcohol dehydrogenase family)
MVADPVFDVSGKVIVLTGGCGLIGRVIARAFVERGAKVTVADLPAAKPDEYARSLGSGARGFGVDVSRSADVAQLVARAQDAFGPADVLINSHQYKPQGFLTAKAEEFPEELWDAVVGVNLKGAFLTCRDFGREMLTRGSGSIINFASTYGIVSSNPDLYEDNSLGNPVAYSASKGGVVMLTRYLGAYWAARGVRVNCVTPHGVWNNHEKAFEERFNSKSPMKRMMRAEEIVGPVLYLASSASSYVTGSNLLVEGGWTAW